MQNLVTVEFRGDTLFAVERDEGVAVAVKPICDRLGLDWNGQVQRIKRDPILLEGMCVIHVPSPGGVQETTCLALRLINGWLFGIDVSRVRPELREHVLAYKRECYEALADRFLGPRAGDAPIRISEDPAMALREFSLREIESKEKLVGRMMQMKGPDYAFALYKGLGLPVYEPEAGASLRQQAAARVFEAHPVLAVLRDFIEGEGAWTGRATQLLGELNRLASPAQRDHALWPRTANALSATLWRLRERLARLGVLIDRRHSGVRTLTITLGEAQGEVES